MVGDDGNDDDDDDSKQYPTKRNINDKIFSATQGNFKRRY